jgi:NAD(P)-dependent dehydrogenase (short-subunit alcohol dehydrogenase family)
MGSRKRVVLITGVAGGIGRAAARTFVDSEWYVIGVDMLPESPRIAVDHYVCADVSAVDACERVFIEAIQMGLGLDALINNAAIQVCKPLIDTSPDEWDRVMGCNVRSAFLCGRNAYPLLKACSGSIVNVSSVHALATSRNMAAYAASKGALLALTRAMAVEFAPDKIRVNAVLPGAVDTEMLRAGLVRDEVVEDSGTELMCRLAEKHLLGRVGRPDEIAKILLFLADNDQSSFMTGQAVTADGGALARLSTE